MSDRPTEIESSDEQVFVFGESEPPPLLPFLNRGKKPTIYYVVAAGLLIIFPIYMVVMFEFVAGPFWVVTAASLLLLLIISRHYFSLVAEARVNSTYLRLRGFRRFHDIPWTDLDSVTVSRQMDPDYITFRLHPIEGRSLAVRRFRLWNKGAALAKGDPVQLLIDAIRIQLVQRP